MMAEVNRRCVLMERSKLVFDEKPIPEAPPDGAVIKVTFAGICHSDVHIAHKFYNALFEFPRVLGHEMSGTIYSLGSGAVKAHPDLSIGDNVLVHPWGMCQNCDNCRADLTYCSSMHYGSGPQNTHVYGIWRDGGYQNYVVIGLAKFLEKVPAQLGMDQAAILTCSGVTAYSAVQKLKESVEQAVKVHGAAHVAVVGAGGLALWAIQILKTFYPSDVKVVAIDIHDDKLADAVAAGADYTHKWGTTESAESAVDVLVKGYGHYMDGVIDFIGLAPVIKRSHLMLHIGGTLALVGISGNEMPDMTLNSVIRRNIMIKGVIVGSQPKCRELIQLVIEGKVRPPPISHVTLDDVPEILLKLNDGKMRGRAVVKM